MAKHTSVEIDTSVLDGILRNLGGNIENAVAKAAFSVEAKAKLRAPVDTGALRASIYTSLKRGGASDKAMGAARALRPDAVVTGLPVPQDDHTAYIGPSVEYGAVVELGDTRRGGRPYLQPAVRETEEEFRKLLAKAVTNK